MSRLYNVLYCSVLQEQISGSTLDGVRTKNMMMLGRGRGSSLRTALGAAWGDGGPCSVSPMSQIPSEYRTVHLSLLCFLCFRLVASQLVEGLGKDIPSLCCARPEEIRHPGTDVWKP